MWLWSVVTHKGTMVACGCLWLPVVERPHQGFSGNHEPQTTRKGEHLHKIVDTLENASTFDEPTLIATELMNHSLHYWPLERRLMNALYD